MISFFCMATPFDAATVSGLVSVHISSLIEQTMMKSLKPSSGLTHGRGLSEAIRCVWVETNA